MNVSHSFFQSRKISNVIIVSLAWMKGDGIVGN